MLFNWDTQNLCLVFESWHITSTFSLLVSLFAVVLMTAGYEGVRELGRQYEKRVNQKLNDMPRKLSIPRYVTRTDKLYYSHSCWLDNPRRGGSPICRADVCLLLPSGLKPTIPLTNRAHCLAKQACPA